MTPGHHRATTLSALALAATTLAPAGSRAGVVDPTHRVEKVGGATVDPVALLPLPGKARALVAQRNGELRLIAGPNLVNTLLTSVPVAQACPGEGLLSAAWRPSAVGRELWISYVADVTPRKLVVARIDITDSLQASAPATVYQINAAADCRNLGGALGWTNDGFLLIGTGDMGNPAAAAGLTSPHGKILRIRADGTINVPGNMLGAVYNLGVRNPVAIVTDPNGSSWFLDRGDVTAAADDELNWTEDQANFGWPTGSGFLFTAGFKDPIQAWSATQQVSGLVSYRADNLPPSFLGDLIVSTQSGTIIRVDTANGDGSVPASMTTLYTPAAGDSWVSSHIGVDGFVHLVSGAGAAWRFRSDVGDPKEPSSATSIVPLLVKKVAGTDPVRFEVSIEKQPGAEFYGPYPGDLSGMDRGIDGDGDTVFDGLNHAVMLDDPAIDGDEAGKYLCADPASTDPKCMPGVSVINDPASAYLRFGIPESVLGGGAAVADSNYLLASARSRKIETVVGQAGDGSVIYGGNLTFGCPCPQGAPVGGKVEGECATPFTLQWGLENETDVIGPVTFRDEWECDIILLDLSEDWCAPCHFLANQLEPLYAQYKDVGFTLLTVISENDIEFSPDRDTNTATQATITAWIEDHGSTNPVLLDERKQVMFQYMDQNRDLNTCIHVGAPRGLSWPRMLLFDTDGLLVQTFCGTNITPIRSGVERELREAGYIP